MSTGSQCQQGHGVNRVTVSTGSRCQQGHGFNRVTVSRGSRCQQGHSVNRVTVCGLQAREIIKLGRFSRQTSGVPLVVVDAEGKSACETPFSIGHFHRLPYTIFTSCFVGHSQSPLSPAALLVTLSHHFHQLPYCSLFTASCWMLKAVHL